MTQDSGEEGSKVIRERVNRARRFQRKRYRDQGAEFCNALLGPKEMRRWCILSQEGKELLRVAIQELGFSMRAYDRILKVARTIADLEDSEDIQPSHISEAIGYRSLDRTFRKFP